MAAGALVVAVLALGLVAALRGSLAQLDGERALPGLSAGVTLERDALGVVTITASNRPDVTRALGFVHAQERFFQMDLLRRSGAGELAALVGPAAVELDQRVRLHRPRTGFRATWDRLPADQRATLTTYAAGVNAGLAALAVRPPEYLLLCVQPEPWLPEDTLAVNLAGL
jgi:penicillin amidase